MTIRATVVVLALLLFAHAAWAEGTGTLHDSGLLVTGAWLEERLADPTVVVVDYARELEDYESGHVPGAARLPQSATLTQAGLTPNMLPHIETLTLALQNVGVDDERTVVVYDEAGCLFASRLFWALEYLGHDDVRVLDGGWNRWAEEERPAEFDHPVVEPGHFTPVVRPERIATYDWILDHLTDPEFLPVDTRTPGEFTGELVRAARGGHIPTAVNLNWEWTVEDDGLGVFRSRAEIDSLLSEVGITPDHKIATYCQAGVRAAHGYLLLRTLGYPCVRVYDGSWVEWAAIEAAPIETGPAGGE